MKLRKLTDDGMLIFDKFISDNQDKKGPVESPKYLLTDPTYSSVIFDNSIEIDEKLNPVIKKQLIRHLINITEKIKVQELLGQPGLWDWITLLYLDNLIPSGQKVHQRPNYISKADMGERGNLSHRHRIQVPYFIAKKYGEDVCPLIFEASVTVGTEFLTNLASSSLNHKPNILQAAHMLYFDEKTGRMKRGYSRDEKGAFDFVD